MKIATNIAAGLLGFVFVAISLMVLLNLVKAPPPPPDSAQAAFMNAFIPTGYMKFVKVLELIGGLLVVVPTTRNFGLLILGPIIVNILAYHLFIANGEGLMGPPLLVVLLGAFLLWAERGKFAALKN